MQLDAAAIRKYFMKLGLDTAVADIYLSLHTYGPQSISQLSRSSGVERTRIYRLVDELMDSNLVEIDASYKRGMLKAAPIANLNILISKKEQELRSLQDELELVGQLLGRNSLSSPALRVQFYNGQEGIKQMLWAVASSKKPVRAILSADDVLFSPQSKYFEDWAKECTKNSVEFRCISNRATEEMAWANPMSKMTLKPTSRQVSSDTFPVDYTTFIFDDVVSSIFIKDGEPYGMETHGKEASTSQRRYFDLLWQQS